MYVHQYVKNTTVNVKTYRLYKDICQVGPLARPQRENPEMKNMKTSTTENKREIRQKEGWANNNSPLMKGGGGN